VEQRAEVVFVSDELVNSDLSPVLMARAMPDSVAKKLKAVLEAVADAPPHKFRGGGYWEAMHGNMKGFHEIRLQGSDNFLYRFFCVVTKISESQERITVLASMRKRKGEKFTTSEYNRVRELARSAGLH
jgi:hypothetical protein